MPAAVPATTDAPGAEDLPIDEYESLAASQVVARLSGLTPAELADVAAFERAHRGRRTVLGKIERTKAVPNSIAESVLREGKPIGAPAPPPAKA